jgi:hypothetical protein
LSEYKILVRKLLEKFTLLRERGLEENIKLYFTEIDFEAKKW